MFSETFIPALASAHESDHRSLVAYFSLSGHTRELARAVCDASAGQLEEITEPRPRDGLSGEARALVDGILRRSVPIRTPQRDPGQFDTLFLGGPVWAGHIAAPVRTYAQKFAPRARKLAFFCTYDADGATAALDELAELCGRPAQAVLAVPAHALVSGQFHADVLRFVSEASGATTRREIPA